ncbi:tRNA uridine 5-oxyacetic acid(34) methyltransferase CmoM [Desulfatiferula olefinivorans]
MRDRNFDDLAERLKTRVYGSPKGRLRMDLLKEDLLAAVPGIDGPEALSVLDAGGGMGQVGVELARLGHRIVLCDISNVMIREAVARFRKEKLDDRLTVVHGPFQDLARNRDRSFDLVLSHAVLEWLADPRSAIGDLAACLKPGGHLSLMFYNQNALIVHNALKGNLKKIRDGCFAGQKGSLTPQNPLLPDHVLYDLAAAGFSVDRMTGIRVFYDAMPHEVRKKLTYEDILDLERTHGRREPFVRLGRYIHVIAHHQGGPTS